MGIVFGFLSLLCLVLLLAKAITHKLSLKKADRFLFKLHKPLSVLFLLFTILHLIFVFPLLKGRAIFVTISGFCIFFIGILLIVLCHTIKKPKQKLFWHRILAFGMLIFAVIHFIVYTVDFNNYQSGIKSIEITEPDLSAISDGVYTGSCDVGYIYAKVNVTVKDGAIEKIDLIEHRNERGTPAEAIIPKMQDQQKIDVDAISGATNSSKVIKKAVENALESAGIK